FGIKAAYADADKLALTHAVGIYLIGWTIFTFLLFLATFRSNGGIMALFFFLTLTFLLLTLGKFVNEDQPFPNGFTRAGGIFGIITALIAWYNALAGLLTPDSSYFTLPTFDLSRK
ncbi:1404_t:CDS:2, partial [Funneliformis caledonium]